eukprot:Clim_evm5s209 gene=Clim_evmTU5s209
MPAMAKQPAGGGSKRLSLDKLKQPQKQTSLMGFFKKATLEPAEKKAQPVIPAEPAGESERAQIATPVARKRECTSQDSEPLSKKNKTDHMDSPKPVDGPRTTELSESSAEDGDAPAQIDRSHLRRFARPTKMKDENDSDDDKHEVQAATSSAKPVSARSGRRSSGGARAKAGQPNPTKEELHDQFAVLAATGPAGGERGIAYPDEGDKYHRRRDPNAVVGKPLLVDPKATYTPLEQQFIDIKRKNLDALLFVETGYKYRFLGDDAEVASRELGIFCHWDKNFMTASIPTHRLYHHVRRLVNKGFKVGVVRQTETAAIKAAGSNKSKPFTRELKELYTRSTLLVNDSAISDDHMGAESCDLMAIFDSRGHSYFTGEDLGYSGGIGVVCINPSTGDIRYETVPHTAGMDVLESVLVQIQPGEIIYPHSISKETRAAIQAAVGQRPKDNAIRVEACDDKVFDPENAKTGMQTFYSFLLDDAKKGSPLRKTNAAKTDDAKPKYELLTNETLELQTAWMALIHYLRKFNIEASMMLTGNMGGIKTRSTLRLHGKTLQNLEIFANEDTGKEFGSLFWLMNNTKTKFGARLLRKWIAAPLRDTDAINLRVATVELIYEDESERLRKLINGLTQLPDLQRGLQRIYYANASPQETLAILRKLLTLSDQFHIHGKALTDEDTTELLNQILSCGSEQLSDFLQQCLSELQDEAAADRDKRNFFTEESEGIRNAKGHIADVMTALKRELKACRDILGLASLEYVSVLQTEFLVEVPNSMNKLVPKTWMKMSATKKVSRYHSPKIIDLVQDLNMWREHLDAEANKQWREYLERVSSHYDALRDLIDGAAQLDCLQSLAACSKQDGYCRPEADAVETAYLDAKDAKHPTVSAQMTDEYVPNNIYLNKKDQRSLIITGPNMGGKSSLIRMTALLIIMAQVGCYVPCSEMKYGVYDAIHTRMGSSDDLLRQQSTFMVEMDEASTALKDASCDSLIIMDELGRGTSTHDGMAVAWATMKYLIERKRCCTLFVTHYPMLGALEHTHAPAAKNYHMGFITDDVQDDAEQDSHAIHFLYQLKPGLAMKSYGLNVARLAHLPKAVIDRASQKSAELEQFTYARLRNRQRTKHHLIALAKLAGALPQPDDGEQTGDSNEKDDADFSGVLKVLRESDLDTLLS